VVFTKTTADPGRLFILGVLLLLLKMLRKYAVLSGILIAIVLLFVATLHYPGGSQADKNSIGYSWKDNYFSNLFNEKAINGVDNASKPSAVAGMFFLCASFALFFYQFPQKIPSKVAAGVIKYFRVLAMVCAFLIATPLHDLMVTVAGTGALVSMFYIAVFIFKSKMSLLKIFTILVLLVFYCCNYLYYTRSYLVALPIMQKVLFVTIIAWILYLEHFTTNVDFLPRKKSQS